MEIVKKDWKKVEEWGERRVKAIWENLQMNNLWQRILKNTLATTIAVIIAIIPAVVAAYGAAAYLAPITTVFGHPGRRFGMMTEALILTVLGTCLGLAWSAFGIYLFSLVYETNASAAYTIRGIFLAIALLFHGFLRSNTPRLFLFVLLMIIVAVVSLTGTSKAVTTASITVILYPVLTAVGVSILVNILVFPEFSSSFLGDTTIETLGETVDTIRNAGSYFVSIGEVAEKDTDEAILGGHEASNISRENVVSPASNPKISLFRKMRRLFQKSKDEKQAGESPKKVTLKSLTDQKVKLRAKLAGCKAAQQECNFEIAFAVLPPADLKSISVVSMNHLVSNAIALIGACESKYALMGDEGDKNKIEMENRAKDADIPSEGHSSSSGTEDDSLPEGSSQDRLSKKAKNRGRKKYRSSNREKKKSKSRKTSLERDIENLQLVKPKKEIESGDIELLRYLVAYIAQPLNDLQDKIDRSVDVVTSCLAYSYDVPKLPSGALTPAGIQLQEIDIRVDVLTKAMTDFDKNSAIALEGAASIHDLEHPQVDIMPRMETFLISLFLLNLRQAALHTLEMLRHARVLVEKRQARYGRRRIYAPQINWRKWLTSGGEEDSLALPDTARKKPRSGDYKGQEDDSSFARSEETPLKKKDLESNSTCKSEKPNPRDSNLKLRLKKPIVKTKQTKMSLSLRVRNGLADGMEYLSDSDDVVYAIKLAVAVMLVTWPAFVSSWNSWFSLHRGLWAALQLVLITEVAIGASVWIFLLRSVGTTLGCVWGYIAYQADNGNRIICVVILTIGIIPSAYIQLGSKYIKAGMVSIISMCIVCLATTSSIVPGTARDNFLKRLIAFLIGGTVALILQFVFLPVKARDRLVESLGSSISHIIEMEACLAYGIEDSARLDVHSTAVRERFNHARSKAQDALTAAETFLPFCANEPRLKGSFKGIALVYGEILYVLYAIIDRMDNMIHLRHEYGSGVLEELNSRVVAYRRNVAASITIVLFAVHEGLMTKLPLPQFLPSARLSHLRMVNRVREVVLERRDDDITKEEDLLDIDTSMVKRIIRQKFLSENAASAGQIEVIEFLEELIDLTKLLVGANEFRTGMLTRPTYREYIDRIDHRSLDPSGHQYDGTVENERFMNTETEEEKSEARDVVSDQPQEKLRKRQTFTRKVTSQENNTPTDDEELEKQQQANEEELPRSLQRVRSRRIEEMNIQRHRSNLGAKTKNEKQRA